MAHISVVCFHLISVLLGETIVTFDTGAKFFKPSVDSQAWHSWSFSPIAIFEVSISHSAEAAFGVVYGRDIPRGTYACDAVFQKQYCHR